MRNGHIGLASAMALASTMATAACSSNSNSSGETGGTASATGGSSSSGGTAPSSGGRQSTGGSATGGAATGGAATGGAATGGAATGGSDAATGGSDAATGGAATGGSATGGAATGGSPPSVTTLSGTEALNALTTAEATQLCNDTYAYFGSAISPATICKWKGLYFATQSSAPTEEKLRSNCTSKETPCLADPGATWSSPSCNDVPSDCTKTVADYSACIRDEVAWLTQKVSELPGCDTFTSAYWTPVWDIVGADQPASCAFCASYYPPDPRNF